MPTDLVFDFFGTLVDYTPGPFNLKKKSYATTHQVLQETGFPGGYEQFVAEFTRVSERLEAAAKETRIEFHMHDLGRAFFTACFGRQPPDAILEKFIEAFVTEWNRGTVFYRSIKSFLDRLAACYRLSIISNTHYPSVVWRNLEAMGVSGHFTQVVTSIEFGLFPRLSLALLTFHRRSSRGSATYSTQAANGRLSRDAPAPLSTQVAA